MIYLLKKLEEMNLALVTQGKNINIAMVLYDNENKIIINNNKNIK